MLHVRFYTLSEFSEGYQGPSALSPRGGRASCSLEEGPTAHPGSQHGWGGGVPQGHTQPPPGSHVPGASPAPWSPDEGWALGLGGQVPTSTLGGRGRAQLASGWNASPAGCPGRHLVSICPARRGPTSKAPWPGHFLCPGRPRGRHQDSCFLPAPPDCPHRRGHPLLSPLHSHSLNRSGATPLTMPLATPVGCPHDPRSPI